ncbi:MAG: hypothetical protein D5S00_10440 [Tindallia sp. MSAO_Bac2]|nr:MAG: hypothetical protein D5S00_10440 [Tindallia sp. MSAO_Bac2]
MIYVVTIFVKDEEKHWCQKEALSTEELFMQSGKNDLTIYSIIERDKQNNEPDKGLCHHRFQPNLIISESNNALNKPGTAFQIGSARFCVLKKDIKCHDKCNKYLKIHQVCDWKQKIIYAKVIKHGTLKIQDPVCLLIDQ